MAPKTMFNLFLLVLVVEFQTSFGQDSVNGAYWLADGGLAASDIDSTLFTHLFCAFANVDSQTYEVTLPSDSSESLSQFTATVQAKNPSVKTLLSIGGGNIADPNTFPAMASQPSSRKSFIDSSIAMNGGPRWPPRHPAPARRPPLLTAAFYYASTIVNASDDSIDYPADAIARSLDWVNAMAYDFYDPSWYKFTQAHSALYDPSGPFSGSFGITAWIAAGVPAEKLVLGMPFYGKAWKLVDAGNPGFLVPADGPAIGDGNIAYKDVKEFIAENGATQGYNSTIVSNYCYSGTTWIGYDDVESISAKVSYAKDNGLLGYFAWQVSQDLNWALSQQDLAAAAKYSHRETSEEAATLHFFEANSWSLSPKNKTISELIKTNMQNPATGSGPAA
nr:chitotriosidase-1-like [Ipomoea batatas]